MIFYIFIFNFFLENITDFAFSFDSCCSCSFKDSQNFFMQSFLLYTSCLFSMLLNDNIVGMKKSDGESSLNFVVNHFSGTFLHIYVLCYMFYVL